MLEVFLHAHEFKKKIELLGLWKVQTGAERDVGAGTEQNRHRFAAPRQTVANEGSWSHWQ